LAVGCIFRYGDFYTDSARLSVRYALARSQCKPGPRSLKAASQPDELTGYCFKAFDVALLSPGKMTRKTTFDLPHDLLRTPNMKQMKET